MAKHYAFTPTEWHSVVYAPIYVGTLISLSDPSGPFGLMTEAFSAASSVLDSTDQADVSPLLLSIAADLQEREDQPDLPPLEASAVAEAEASTRIRAALAAVDARAPAEALIFRSWLYTIALQVAKSAREGPLFGLGSAAVSAAEEAVLGRLAALLDIA